jgi:hypothetical protein
VLVLRGRVAVAEEHAPTGEDRRQGGKCYGAGDEPGHVVGSGLDREAEGERAERGPTRGAGLGDPGRRRGAALPTAARRIPRCAPIRSTRRPMIAEASDDVRKNIATATPSAAAPKSSSPRTCTASPPVRKAGSTPAVATATAIRTGRRFKASRSVEASFSTAG